MVVVARGGVAITLRVIVQGLTALRMMIGMMIRRNDARSRQFGMIVSRLCCVLYAVNHTCGRRAGKHERQCHAQRRKQPSKL